MSYTQNLGKVKGEKGDYYTPSVSIEDGQFVFNWEESAPSTDMEDITQKLNIPIFVPNYDSTTGNLTFTPSSPIIIDGNLVTSNTQQFVFHVKGDPGTVTVKIKTEHTNKTIETLKTELNNQKAILQEQITQDMTENEIEELTNTIITFKSDTLYFTIVPNEPAMERVYVYDDNKKEFNLIEGIDLSDYCKKTETYSKNDIDNLLDTQNIYLEKIWQILETANDIVDTDGFLSNYIEKDNIDYIEENGVTYLIKKEPEEEEEGE